MRPPWETSAEPKAPRRSRQGRVIDLEEVRDLGQPARLDEAHVIGVLVVRRVRGLIGELHRDAEPVRVLRARLAQDLERLDTGNCREVGGGAQEVGLLRRSLGVRWREDDRVPDAAPAECAAVHAACLRSIPPRTIPTLSRLATSWPERKRSTCGSAARIPPASGSYSTWPLSGFTQTTANAWRARRAISRPVSCASPRSQPSERMTTTAPRVSARLPH